MPISAKPNPSAGQAGHGLAHLSKPAASPTGLGKRVPSRSCASRPPPSGGAAMPPMTGAARASESIASSCARSGSRRKRGPGEGGVEPLGGQPVRLGRHLEVGLGDAALAAGRQAHGDRVHEIVRSGWRSAASAASASRFDVADRADEAALERELLAMASPSLRQPGSWRSACRTSSSLNVATWASLGRVPGMYLAPAVGGPSVTARQDRRHGRRSRGPCTPVGVACPTGPCRPFAPRPAGAAP